jgi:hypothetical protein
MLNRANFISCFVRWILPLLVVLLIGLYLVLAPIAFTHAAAPAMHHNVAAPHKLVPEDSPDAYWPPR